MNNEKDNKKVPSLREWNYAQDKGKPFFDPYVEMVEVEGKDDKEEKK